MNRADFLKTLGLASSGLILPKNLLGRNLVKIYDNYLRGLPYYHYKTLKNQLSQGDSLQLLRELDNAYDAFAVAVYVGDYKLGYLPAFENIVIANMLDAQVALTAQVSDHNPDNDPYQYEVLAVEIFAELITPTPQLLTELQNARASDAEDIYRRGYFS